MAVGAILHLDFETRSAVDLRTAGLDIYAADTTTDVLCAAYAFDDEEVDIWRPGMPCPPRLYDHLARNGEVWSHNAPFEILINNKVMFARYGWPWILHTDVVCTMAMAYAMGLPGSLDNCAAALGIEARKDQEGARIMMQLSRPRTIEPKLTWWDEEQKLQRLYEYCKQDVRVEREVGKRMPRLSTYERRVWNLDFQINRRGFQVDTLAVKKAIALVEAEKIRLDEEMRVITDNQVASCTAISQIKKFLEPLGISGDSLDKAAVQEHLTAPSLSPVARRVLELRAEAGRASTAKLTPMLETAGEDGRVRGCFQYSGANTRRFTGRRVQLHNLMRPTLKFPVIEAVIEEISKGTSAAMIDLSYGPVMGILPSCIRSFFRAAPGKQFAVADFSAIEARVLAWLAGQEDVVKVFRKGEDIYKVAAASIFGCAPSEVTDDQRQVGKVAVLALGYGGGVGAFQTMARAYNVKMAPAYQNLISTAPQNLRARAFDAWENRKSGGDEISREEFIASDLTKLLWREANFNIVNYWYVLEDRAISACCEPNCTFSVDYGDLPLVKYRKVGSFLWCMLPGGGVICYPYPEIKEVKTPWGAMKQALTYMAEDGQTRKWQRFSTYGGSLAENITQAVSRDLLVDAMLRLDSAGFDIVSHVHDEIICETDKGEAALPEMIRIMTENPPWAKGLPIKAAGFVSIRYRK